jgi:hypothetical protein
MHGIQNIFGRSTRENFFDLIIKHVGFIAYLD